MKQEHRTTIKNDDPCEKNKTQRSQYQTSTDEGDERKERDGGDAAFYVVYDTQKQKKKTRTHGGPSRRLVS